MAGRTNKLTDGKFCTSIKPKGRHAIADCVDPKKKRVLEFVMPIQYSENLSQVTLTVGNTIFGTLSWFRKVNWRQVLQEVVGKLVSGLEKGKSSPISLYLFHLYHRLECLREEDMQQLEVAKHCLEYSVGLKAETQLDVVEIDSKRESLNSMEQRKILVAFPGSRRKFTFWSPEGKSPKPRLESQNNEFIRLQG